MSAMASEVTPELRARAAHAFLKIGRVMYPGKVLTLKRDGVPIEIVTRDDGVLVEQPVEDGDA
jgi:hypothetical protein